MTANGHPRVRDGLIDTNIFVHAQARDADSEGCKRFLLALARGEVRAIVEPIVLHELSYALPRFVKQMSKRDVAAYMLMVLSWPGVLGDKDLMSDAVQRWYDTPGLAFADAFLAARAASENRPVYTKNVRELRSQDVDVPDPLPSGT